METPHVPAYIGQDAKGDTDARVAPTLFPITSGTQAPLIHRITAYNKSALWDDVQAWFDGGEEVYGQIKAHSAAVQKFETKGGATWRIYMPDTPQDQRAPLAWSSFATPVALDDFTNGYD